MKRDARRMWHLLYQEVSDQYSYLQLDAQKPEVSCKNICFWVGEIDMMKVFVSKTFVLTKWIGDIIFLISILGTFGDSETCVNFHQVGIRLCNKMGSVPNLKKVYDKPRNAQTIRLLDFEISKHINSNATLKSDV